MAAPFGTYTASEGTVFRDGCYLGKTAARRLLALFEADHEPHAKALAVELRAALREAQSYTETEAA